MSTPTYFRNLSHFGRFRVSGKDAASLLHHLTTGDIKKLQARQGCDAILVSNKARVLDWLSIWREGDEYRVLTSPNRRALFASHAPKFILFRQDVKIEDVSNQGALWGLFGDQARGVLASWNAPEIFDAPMNARVESGIGDSKLQLSRTRRLPANGVLIQCDDGDNLQKLIAENGASTSGALTSGASICDDETYNTLRIESGIPVAGLELTEDINPWEANLDFAISLSKGCYNGQEVIARLHTYQKIKQRLMGLKLESPIEMSELSAGRVLLKSDGRDAGFVTSAANSPRFGPIALAFVRTDFQSPGRELKVLASTPQAATVSGLPFQ